MKVRQFEPLGGQAVDLRCLEMRIAKTTDARVAHVVHHDDHEIGFLRLRRGKRAAKTGK